MNVNVDDIIKSLPQERQQRIKALAQKKIEETLAYTARQSDSTKGKKLKTDEAPPVK